MSHRERKVLLVFAHPALPLSAPDRAILNAASASGSVTVSDLYKQYQSKPIDTTRERHRLAAADDVIFHYPVLQHREPTLLRHWLDRVLDPNWYTAAGAEVIFSGTRVRVTTLVSTGEHTHTMRRLQQWRIDEQTTALRHRLHSVHMRWLAPMVFPVPEHAGAEQLASLSDSYTNTLFGSCSSDEGTPQERSVVIS